MNSPTKLPAPYVRDGLAQAKNVYVFGFPLTSLNRQELLAVAATVMARERTLRLEQEKRFKPAGPPNSRIQPGLNARTVSRVGTFAGIVVLGLTFAYLMAQFIECTSPVFCK